MIRSPKRKSKPKLDVAVPTPGEVEFDIEIDLEEPVDSVEELELTDDDFVLLESAPPPPPISRSVLREALAAIPPPPRRPISEARLETLRTKTLRAGLPDSRGALPAAAPVASAAPNPRESRRSFSRIQVDEAAVASVADECLASIAAAASHARGDETFPAPRSSMPLTSPASSQKDAIDALLDTPAVGRLPRVAPLGLSSAMLPPADARIDASSVAARLPPVRPPPFLRSFSSVSAPSSASVPGLIADDADAAATLPNPVKTPFARRMIDERVPPPPPPPSNDSVAPVALARAASNANGRGEPTVIVVRERPRALWVVAAAAIGALAAATVMRIVPSSPAPVEASTPTAPPPAAAAAVRVKPAVVQFSEDEGVSIHVPAPAAAPATPPAPSHAVHAAPRVHAPAAPTTRVLHPKVSAPTPLPDGSLGLASTGKASASSAPAAAAAAPTPSPAPTPLPLPPGPARKRALTPEQELAEAQLRAATR